MEALERRQKAIEVEWDEMFDRFRRLLMKLSKRSQRETEDFPKEPASEVAPGRTNGGGSIPTAGLARRFRSW